jgi:hypothetical protein
MKRRHQLNIDESDDEDDNAHSKKFKVAKRHIKAQKSTEDSTEEKPADKKHIKAQKSTEDSEEEKPAPSEDQA